MKNILKFAFIFLLSSMVFSLFGSYVTNLFVSFNGTLYYITTGSIGMVLTEIISFVGWLLDLIFLNTVINSYTLVTAPSVTVGSIAYALSLFRILLGCSIFILLLSLVFGKGGSD